MKQHVRTHRGHSEDGAREIDRQMNERVAERGNGQVGIGMGIYSGGYDHGHGRSGSQSSDLRGYHHSRHSYAAGGTTMHLTVPSLGRGPL